MRQEEEQSKVIISGDNGGRRHPCGSSGWLRVAADGSSG